MIIELSDDRNTRVRELRKLYDEENKIITEEGLIERIKNCFLEESFIEKNKQFNLPLPDSISISFYSESDDEGGSYKAVEDVNIYKDGKELYSEYTEATYTEVDWRGNEYEANMWDFIQDWLRDAVNEDRSDIYEYFGWEPEFNWTWEDENGVNEEREDS